MSLFAVRCTDGPGAGPLRQQHLAAHLAHVEANMARYRIAGPLAGTGSLLIVEAEDAAAARAFAMADPYGQAGVWAEVIVEDFIAAAGTWVGGAAWKQPR